MGYRKGYYRKDGTYVQGHYTNNRSKYYSNKNNGCVILTLLFIAFTTIISCSESSDSVENSNSGSGSNSNCPTKTCGDFSTQAQAQATYDSNRKCYKNLDADGDGKACESLK
ncbi:excalibur calcium-binding domain-containing protein [Flavobacterium chungbukense]|uniref:Excalibur calcium-binding domain-containing protein n=1 Tax=Flavobacterium chungbukense TaxID=877464 RepID=A0ABP7YPZ0_9FLAO|nr:excalibur calcium-binding domain-containing protein [Flavobacterium chungbukense]MCC4919809.1 excalibur calcium-binding domain-containing protein [Flavobacterium chungbukense]